MSETMLILYDDVTKVQVVHYIAVDYVQTTWSIQMLVVLVYSLPQQSYRPS